MKVTIAIVAAVLIVPALVEGQGLPPSPVKRLVISPSPLQMVAQDTLRLRVQALDANGQPVPNVVLNFLPSSGARFEGRVTPDGLVQSGATGTLPVTVTANVTGYAPVVERVEVVMVPAAAGRIEIEPPARLLVGQQIQLLGRVYSIHGEPRTDAINWRDIIADCHRDQWPTDGGQARQGDHYRDRGRRHHAASTSTSWLATIGHAHAHAVRSHGTDRQCHSVPAGRARRNNARITGLRRPTVSRRVMASSMRWRVRRL